MSDLTPLLREAADALWLIPIHAGLAQRLTNAAERTRPSDAEVTDAMVAAGVAAMEGHAPRLVSRAPEYDEPLAVALRHSFVRNILTAALSTPPLPSAEPVAWKVEESLDGRVYNTFWFGDDPERAERIRARMDSLGVKMTPLYTTPPAAAQDTARLDWLENEMNREQELLAQRVIFGPMLSLFRRNTPITRAAIDNAMQAARAAGGE